METYRVILAVVLSFLVLFLWQIITFKPKPQHLSTEPSSIEQRVEITASATTKPEEEKKFDPFVVETKNLKLVYNKFGAGIREIYLRDKNDDILSLICKEEKDSFSTFPEVNYHAVVTKQEDETVILFTGKKDKYLVKKIYKIKDNFLSSWIDVETNFSVPQEKVEFLWQHFIRTDEFTAAPNDIHIGYTTQLQEKETILVRKISSLKRDTKNLVWAGVSGKYFLVSIFPQKDLPGDIHIDKLNKNTKFINLKLQNITNYKFKIFISPKSVPVLKSAGYKLHHTIEWGLFSPLSKLFYEILSFFYKIFKNYGVAIIGLTILLQIISFPLTYNSLKSTLKLRQIQPQIQLLQKVYKSDPKRLNAEIMHLYRSKKINPFGGCLPLVLQIPIFWTLFTMLSNTYDLYRAKFIFWIKDLSQPDRIFIPGINFGIPVLVILMGLSMFIQQLSSGAGSDPNQKIFMFVFPVMFTIMFFNFPSGLVLYWFVNNIFTIIIQAIINIQLKKQTI